MRSMYSRLNSRGQRGPKSLKPFEAVFNLGELVKKGVFLKEDSTDVNKLIDKTCQLLSNHGDQTENILNPGNLVCNKCGETLGCLNKSLINVEMNDISSPVSLEEILKKCLQKPIQNICQHQDFNEATVIKKNRLMIIQFTNPVNIDIHDEITLWGNSWTYASHIQDSSLHGDKKETAYFQFKNNMYFQNPSGKLEMENFGLHFDVKFLAVCTTITDQITQNFDLAYTMKTQNYLQKNFIAFVNPI